VRHSVLPFVLVPMGVVLVVLGIYQLVVVRAPLAAAVGILTGVALVGICLYDAPPDSRPAVAAGDPPPGTSRRVAVAYWSLLVATVGAVVIGMTTSLTGWLAFIPLLPIFGAIAVLQARAEGASVWSVIRRGFGR
jgi:hypothetical protein